MERVPDKIDFPLEEEKINDYWRKKNTFRNSLHHSKTRKKFTFFDGPPFATGLPHYGHILAGSIKDIVTRFAHQSGHHVSRRFGWDCHGLPVEYEVDKTLGIKAPSDVLDMGIDKYNAHCRSIVMRYSKEWEIIMERLARWIDFDYDYKTLYPWYMESIWWVFHELYIKGLVYKGVKVMPYSTACNTPLSNFESGQNYKEVVDPQVVVGFPLDTDPSVMLVVWTTTPWTLPSNLATCVHPDLVYVKVKSLKNNEVYIMMEARLCMLFKKEKEYQILDKFPGQKLKGLGYQPLFPYFAELKAKGAFKVLTDKYVSDDAGTGIVHQAPYFGEDDYRVCLAEGIISRDQKIVCPVDDSGRFVKPVVDFEGDHVKDADKKIIKYMKEKCPRRLIEAGSVKHSYPFCWRSDTPLIYRAVPSWFVRVEQMVENLLQSSQATYWVPDFVKDKRFGNWLKGARDWAISRNRYWGTPIPLWVSEDGKEVVCVGSIKQLEELTNQKITDLHRESIDNLTIPSVRPGMPPLRRVSEVFDCWFESGSMPYAQVHFPFNRSCEIDFHQGFPADFIAEGIDQTRGWFYTLIVISTALFNKPPFKNLIANGLVLAADGQKMSKRKKNYPDPIDVVKKYGADSLRLYLINSPVVRAENLRFKEEGVRDVLKDVLLPWYNAYRYLAQSIERLETEGQTFKYSGEENYVSTNTMDKWIKSATQTMVATVWREMARFHLYKVVPLLLDYIDQLTNWYIRMNRKRLKGDGGERECLVAVNTLFGVLFTFVRIMAPFTPFLCELMYTNLRKVTSSVSAKPAESIHFLDLPKPVTSHIDIVIERRIKNMQYVISSGRIIRDKRTVPMKYPLPELIVIHKDQQYLDDLQAVKNYILEELNIKSLVLSTDCSKYKVTLAADVDHKSLGARLKGDFKSVLKAVKELSDSQVQEFLKNGQLEVLGHMLNIDEVFIAYRFEEGSFDSEKYETWGSKEVALMFDMTRNASMLDEGMAREVVNLVQKLRKKGQFVPTDPITVYYKITPEDSDLATVITSQKTYIENSLKVPLRPWSECENEHDFVVEESSQLKGCPGLIQLKIVHGFCSDWSTNRNYGIVESVKRKNTTPSTQAAKVVKSEETIKTKEMSPQMKSRGRERKKSQSKDFRKSLPQAKQDANEDSQLIKISNGHFTMSPSVRHILLRFHKELLKNTKNVKNGEWVVPLENPSEGNEMTLEGLKREAAGLISAKGENLSFHLVKEGNKTEELQGNLKENKFSSAVVFVCPKTCDVSQEEFKEFKVKPSNFPDQPFVNVTYNKRKGIVFLVGPDGTPLKADGIIQSIAKLYSVDPARIVTYRPLTGYKNEILVSLN
ncbi:hypothetical protein RUM44_000938 [Polyplax serrata]|uniref:isoleucine--tRNA ligase n=1 Tax=Polyplax serrata TaxID=468196 RepID=A0ABR1B6H9_POLSC